MKSKLSTFQRDTAR